ncbi:MAG: SagB/ThcOx family dehydrogenase [Candidatus Omnitrophica bacterium]|nr:SagB/ThcOx family dehydrogenase [Candidatus Omnitrophota bacterium]
MKKNILILLIGIFVSGIMVISGFAQDKLTVIQLPQPNMQGGKPLMQVLKERQSSRNFIDNDLSLQTLADLLWAGFGINRPESGMRTAPSAHNMQEIDIYVAMNNGLYVYDAKNNQLSLVLDQDIRKATGMQEFVEKAAVNLVYVVNYSRMAKIEGQEMKQFYACLAVGHISENVYLFCASEGLATVTRGWVDKPALAKVMKLSSEQEIILAQTVGYKK